MKCALFCRVPRYISGGGLIQGFAFDQVQVNEAGVDSLFGRARGRIIGSSHGRKSKLMIHASTVVSVGYAATPL